MRKKFIAAAVAAAALVTAAGTAGAITRGGELDGDAHPYVGVMVAYNSDGVPQWRCSGTLVSPTVYVTAGHCTEGAASAAVWFENDVDASRSTNGYPWGGGTEYTGTPHLYDRYLSNAFYYADLGVVVLDQPYVLDDYASLPTVGYVDTIDGGRKNSVTAVGYGLQAASQNPVKADKVQADVVRYQADLFIVDTNGAAGIGSIPGSDSMVLSGDAKHGGTCFGDSGGPTLDGTTLLAVTSFGLNGNCAGIGGVYRIDGADQLAWINGFLGD